MAIARNSDQFLLDAYTGQGGFITGAYLVQHHSESSEAFARRQALAVYPNFVRKIVDVYLGLLWRQAPSRDAGEAYAAFAVNADGAGHNLDYLLASYQRLAMLLGTVYVIVDKPITPSATRADEKPPYIAHRLPAHLVRSSVDSSGVWFSVTFSEMSDGAAVYRTFTRTGWVLSEDAAGTRIIAQGEHGLGRVPVVALHSAYPINPTDKRAMSWVFDLVQLNWSLYNMESGLNALFRDQEFSVFAMPVSDGTERERLQQEGLVLGTQNGLLYDPANGGEPKFIAPPDGPVKQHMEKNAATVQDLYRIANLEFVGGVQQSGVALSFHFQEANSALSTMADLCEQAEREIAQLVHAWQGQVFEGHIAYPRDFNLTDVAQALTLAMDAVSLSLSPRFDRELKKRLVKQILGSDTAPDVLAAIDAEIDADGDVYGDRVAQAAGSAGP
ncbi:MAG: hypothetical protein EPN21_06290 [Methylococcaceae bacterium]|nr:MAG: hypothetical protein EPN21_06290 [Methylococcaceae bacterium]